MFSKNKKVVSLEDFKMKALIGRGTFGKVSLRSFISLGVCIFDVFSQLSGIFTRRCLLCLLCGCSLLATMSICLGPSGLIEGLRHLRIAFYHRGVGTWHARVCPLGW